VIVQAHLVLNHQVYEDNSINISVDDVCVKEQKAHRKEESVILRNKNRKETLAINGSFKQDYKPRKFAYQTVIHLQ
jgi:hypothetical protein